MDDHNRCSQISLLLTVLLFGTTSIPVISGQPTGIYLSLNGEIIPNDSYILVTAIGEGSGGLLCNTDRSDCCRGSYGAASQGQWYFPDPPGGQVLIEDMRTGNFFYRDRGDGVVRLNRRNNPAERGRFRCEIPDINGDMVNLYVNIVDPPPATTAHSRSATTEPPITTETVITTHKSTTAAPLPPVTITVAPITSSGAATAGESYSLECTVTVTGSVDQPTITWLIGSMNNMITSGVMTNRGMSTLTLDPLSASHAGIYTCRATLGSVMGSASRTITVQNPTITISVASSVATPILGSMYSLNCTVTGAEGLTSAMVTYQWLKDGAVVSDQTMATLSFSPLTFSDAGSYTCRGTVTSSRLLSDPISQNSTNAANINNINPMLPAVYLYLHGRIYISNSSYIDIDDIGEGDDEGLFCVTDLTQCCRIGVDTPGDTVLGRWFYPNGTDVLVAGEGYDVYSSRGPSIVRINRRNNIRSPTGLYCCEVPDVTNTLRRVCANIGARALSEEPCAISSSSGANIGISVGTLLLVEGVIAVVITVVMVSCYFVIRRRRKSSEKSVDFAVSANMAYGEVRLEDLGDVGEKYEDPDKLARSGRGGGGSEGNYELTECPAPYVSKPEAPVYATADDTTNSGCGKITA